MARGRVGLLLGDRRIVLGRGIIRREGGKKEVLLVGREVGRLLSEGAVVGHGEMREESRRIASGVSCLLMFERSVTGPTSARS